MCVTRIFSKWSSDYICFVGLIESAASFISFNNPNSRASLKSRVSGQNADASFSKSGIVFVQYLIHAVFETFSVFSYLRYIAEAACMHELEFLLAHPSSEIDVTKLCNLVIEPTLTRLNSSLSYEDVFTQKSNSQQDFSGTKNSFTNIESTGSFPPAASPPTILRCVMLGLVRALGLAHALAVISVPLSGAILKALVLIQQQRYQKILIVAQREVERTRIFSRHMPEIGICL